MSKRVFHIPHDPVVSERIREALAEGPKERPIVQTPRPTPAENLRRWKIAAAEAVSPAEYKARVERRGYMPIQPGEWSER